MKTFCVHIDIDFEVRAKTVGEALIKSEERVKVIHPKDIQNTIVYEKPS